MKTPSVFGNNPATKAKGEVTTRTITAASLIININTVITTASAAETINRRIVAPPTRAAVTPAAISAPVAAVPVKIPSTGDVSFWTSLEKFQFPSFDSHLNKVLPTIFEISIAITTIYQEIFTKIA